MTLRYQQEYYEQEHFWGNEPSPDNLARINEIISLIPNCVKSVLDVGCGDGHFASITFEQPLDVGIDPWTGPIRQAASYGCYRLLIQAEGAELPFPDEYFASAISNSVLEHIPDVKAVLSETARVLKPGAPFIFCVPNPRYLSELSIPAKLNRLHLPRIGAAYTDWFGRMSRVHHAEPPEVWQTWLEQAGFNLDNWWHYFSPEAMRVLEWGHFFGAPTLLPHLLTKKWIIAPTLWNLALTEKIIRPYAQPRPDVNGVFTFFIAKKSSIVHSLIRSFI